MHHVSRTNGTDKLLGTIAAAFLIACVTGPALCQEGGEETSYVPSQLSDMTVQIGPTTIDIQFYEAVRTSSGQSSGVSTPGRATYAFTPYFSFTQFGTPLRKYDVYDSGGGTKTIRMRLALYDDSLKRAAALWVSDRTNTHVAIGDLQVLPIFTLKVMEQNTGQYAMFPEGSSSSTTRIALSPVQDVYFRNMSAPIASTFTQLLDTGNADFTFEYSFKKAGTILGSYTVRYKDIQQNTIFQQLTGAGGTGLVTRDGAARVASLISSTLDVTSYIEDPAVRTDLTNDILSLFLDKMKFNQKLDYGDAKNLDQLSSLTVDPHGSDFEADQLNKTHEILRTSRDFNEVNKKLRDGGGSVGVGPFKADANFKSNDEVTQAIKDTFDRDWTGDDWSTLPKSINVYQLNGADFTGEATVRNVAVRPNFWMLTTSVSAVQAYPTQKDLSEAVLSGNADRFVLVPVGTVIAYAAPINAVNPLPDGWLLCDGSPLRKTDYDRLYAAIGTAYGDGRDNDNNKVNGFDFNLPDYRGYFLRGVDAKSGHDLEIGARVPQKNGGNSRDSVGSFQPEALRMHSHPVDDPGHTHNIQEKEGVPILADINGGFGHGGGAGGGRFTDFNKHPITTDTTNIRVKDFGGAETRPSNVSVNWLIRAR